MSEKKLPTQRKSVRGIRLIDTCILCEILEIPGKSNPKDSQKYSDEYDLFAGMGGRFVLPLATLIETGNHIAQNGDGKQRRKAADAFVKFVQAAMDDESPFLKSEIWNADVGAWLANYPDNAMRGKGLGDVSIEVDSVIVKRTFGVSGLDVEIWTKDKHIGESEVAK